MACGSRARPGDRGRCGAHRCGLAARAQPRDRRVGRISFGRRVRCSDRHGRLAGIAPRYRLGPVAGPGHERADDRCGPRRCGYRRVGRRGSGRLPLLGGRDARVAFAGPDPAVDPRPDGPDPAGGPRRARWPRVGAPCGRGRRRRADRGPPGRARPARRCRCGGSLGGGRVSDHRRVRARRQGRGRHRLRGLAEHERPASRAYHRCCRRLDARAYHLPC